VKSGEGVKIKMIDDILNAYQATLPAEEYVEGRRGEGEGRGERREIFSPTPQTP
jgi:hypothetical protein